MSTLALPFISSAATDGTITHRASSFRAAGMPSPVQIYATPVEEARQRWRHDVPIEGDDRLGLVVRTKSFAIYDNDRTGDRFKPDLHRWIITDLDKQGEVHRGYDRWSDVMRSTGLSRIAAFADPDRLHRERGAQAYECLVAEAARQGLPHGYRDDLFVHDRSHLLHGTLSPCKFGWVLRENGTHLVDPRSDSMRNSRESLGIALLDAFKDGPRHFYLFEDDKLHRSAPERWADTLRQWRHAAENCGEIDRRSSGPDYWSRPAAMSAMARAQS